MRGEVYHSHFGTVVNYESEPLPAVPDVAVANTLRKMTRYALEDKGSRVVTDAVVESIPRDGFTPVTLLEDFHAWIRRHVRFVEDDELSEGARFGKGNEILIRPVDLLRMPEPSEDCDGFSMLAAAMVLRAAELLKIPYQVNFVTVAADAFHPDEFSHVYLYVSLDGKVFPFDASHGAYVGWETPDKFHKRAVWPIGDFMLAVRSPGLGRYRYNRRMAGLGTCLAFAEDGSCIYDDSIGAGSPAAAPASSGVNWNALLPGLFSAGEQVIKQVTLPTGAYVVQTPTGSVMASNVPGAVPGAPGVSASLSAGAGTWLLLGGGALLLALFSKGRG